jgi:hypothetical protein
MTVASPVTSIGVQAVLFMLVAVVIVLAARVLLHRAYGDIGNGTVDTVMEPLAGVYGLLLAFLVGGVADRATDLRGALQLEAEAYVRVDEIAQRMAPPMGGTLHQSLQRYARAELAARAGRPTADESVSLLNDIWLSLLTFETSVDRDNLLRSEALAELSVLREQRTVAGRASRHAYGFLIWLVLVTGAFTVIGVCMLAGLADPRAPIYLAALTAMIAITLYVFYALSRPLTAMPFRTLVDVAGK